VPGQRQAPLTATVLLATYNRRALLPGVLEPVLADPAAAEVVVVVDGAADGSIELLREMASKDARIKPVLISNSGLARALETGAREATGDVLVIIDDDEIVEPGSISGHLGHHSHRGGLLVVGYVEMELPASRRRGDFSRYIYAEQYERDCANWEAAPASILRNLWGGFVSIGRIEYLRVVAESEFVQGYHYDLDFGARCAEQGFSAVFDRSLSARHLYERDRRGFLGDGRSSGRNRILVHRAHPELLGSLEPTFVDDGLPRVGRAALSLALGHPAIEWLISTGATVAGALHLWRLETLGATLMWAVAQKRGALEAVAGTASAALSLGPGAP
jgi:glycosyltransferase involved in cell wall biosynthesis